MGLNFCHHNNQMQKGISKVNDCTFDRMWLEKEPIGVVISLGLGLQYRHAIDGWTILQKLGKEVNIIVFRTNTISVG